MKRTARLWDLVHQDIEARALDRERPRAVCFGDYAEGMVTEHGVVLLDAREGDAQLAATMAHMLVHLRNGDRATGWAGLSEAQARGLESRMRQRLGLP